MQRAASATTNSGKLTGASASVDLPGQWLIAKDARLVPAGWQSMQLGNFHVTWNAPLPCTRLPGNAATSGLILGWYTLLRALSCGLGPPGLGDQHVLEESAQVHVQRRQRRRLRDQVDSKRESSRFTAFLIELLGLLWLTANSVRCSRP